MCIKFLYLKKSFLTMPIRKWLKIIYVLFLCSQFNLRLGSLSHNFQSKWFMMIIMMMIIVFEIYNTQTNITHSVRSVLDENVFFCFSCSDDARCHKSAAWHDATHFMFHRNKLISNDKSIKKIKYNFTLVEAFFFEIETDET